MYTTDFEFSNIDKPVIERIVVINNNFNNNRFSAFSRDQVKRVAGLYQIMQLQKQ
jgi:hypothetical protein